MLHAIKQAVLFATRPLVCTSLLVAVVASGPTRGSEQGRTGRLVGTYETAKTLTLNRAYVLVVNDAGEIEDSTSAKPGKPFVFESIREGGKFIIVIPQDGNAVPATVETFVLSAGETQITMHLEAGEAVGGMVTDATGTGFPGVTVKATMKLDGFRPWNHETTAGGVVFTTSPLRASDGPPGSRSTNLWELDVAEGELARQVQSDREGRFRIEGFGRSPVKVSISSGSERLNEQWVIPGPDLLLYVSK